MTDLEPAARHDQAPAAAPAPYPLATGIPAGWYPQGGTQRYWDGTAWTEHVAPLAAAAATPVHVVVAAGGATAGKAQHVSGMTTGQHLKHGIITACTLGVWAPVWGLIWFLGRRRIR